MMPELATCGATSAAMPAWVTVIRPRLTTAAPGAAGWSNTMCPAMKFWLVIPAAVAMKPAVLICAPLVKVIPSWFSRITWPLALICPAIWDGFGPTTRFSATAAAFGCWKFTDCPEPTSKLCQLIAARWVVWWMLVAFRV